MTIPFFLHDLGTAELDSIAEVLAGPILTTGETVRRFEQRFAAYLGVKHALGVTSCTGALHLSLLALGIGPGDEVITTPMTFIATSTAILEAGASPVFCDIETSTGNLDASQIEDLITARTRAIIPVHLYGHLCDMRTIRAIADRHHLHIIEDAAHCVEGNRDGIRVGELSDTACFSFYATKNLTCGEGGAVVTNDDELAEKLRILRLHGMTKTAADRAREGYKHWDMTVLGWKYNMDNIQAALLLPQMDRLEENLRKREAAAQRYFDLLKMANIPGLSWPQTLPGTCHARHLFPVLVPGGRRDEVVTELQKRDIGVMVNYRAIHLLTYFRDLYDFEDGALPVAEQFGSRVISLPFYPAISDEYIQAVVQALVEILK